MAQVFLNVNGYELSDQRRLHQQRFIIHVSMYGTESSYEFVLTLCCHSWTPRPSTITHGMGGIKAIKKSRNCARGNSKCTSATFLQDNPECNIPRALFMSLLLRDRLLPILFNNSKSILNRQLDELKHFARAN